MSGLPDGQHGPHVLVESVDAPIVEGDDRHHLDRVLRLRDGEPVTVGDGAGRWRPCRWGPTIEPVGEVVFVDPPEPRLGVAFALIKGGRPELVVQKLVELGIDDIRPFTAARSVVRWDDEKAAKHHERLTRVAREALMQCRRVWLPVVHPPVDFASVAALPGAALADRAGPPPTLEHPTILVGPEGGWTSEERAAGLSPIGLSAAVLRAETASIVAGALLAARRDLTT